MKKILLAAALAVLLTGCGTYGDDSSSADTSVNTNTAPETNVSETEAAEAEAADAPDGASGLVMRIGDQPDGKIVLTGEDIESAEPFAVMEENDMLYSVVLTFNDEGREKLAKITSELAGTETPLAIWGDGELISAPCVSTPIDDGKAVITGDFTVETSMELSRRIVPLSIDDMKKDEE